MSEPERGGRSFRPDFLQELFAHPLDAGYLDARDRRERLGPPGQISRRTGFAVRTFILIATGLLLAIAYQQTVAAKPSVRSEQSSLVSDVRERQATTDALAATADTLRTQVTRLRNAALDQSAAQQLTQLEAATGLGPVTGPGVTVTMADGPTPSDPVTGQAEGVNNGRVLDLDLQVVTNQLWSDGAEAISINGQRIISTSTIRTAGSAILVDFVPLTQPYVISAIGPSAMADRLRDSAVGGTYERLADSYGMRFDIADKSGLSVPAAGDPQLQYATTGSPSPGPSPSGGH